nr:putative phosphatase [uncultured bacterium]
MYSARERLVILDVDGTAVDAFSAIDIAFARSGMDIGNLERFQKRRKLFKYLGGLREFPVNLHKQFGKQSRKQLVARLTDVYREEAQLYPGVPELIRALLAATDVRIGLVTRNVTNEPRTTLQQLFARHDIDLNAFDLVACLGLGEDKKHSFKAMRERYVINPARSFVCGDEFSDFAAAIASGMHPLIVSYGFEDYHRLVKKFEVPEEVISRTPAELCARLRNAMDLPLA